MLLEPVQEFTDAHLNEVPALDAIADGVRAVERLREGLNTEPLSADLRELAETVLSAAAEVWTRGADVPPDALTLARTVLLDLRSHRLPPPAVNGEVDDGMTIPPGPRGNVARGLLQLARFPGRYDQEIGAAIQTLARDLVPWVRYSVASGLPWLRWADPEMMWNLLHERAGRDSSDRVCHGIVCAALKLRSDPAAVDVIRRVAERVTPSDQRDSAFEACTEAAGLIWVLDGDQRARALLEQLTDVDKYGIAALAAMLHEVRTTGAPTHDDDAIRGRALDLYRWLAEIGFTAMGDLSAAPSQPTQDEQARMRAGLELLADIAAQLYFASGALDAKKGAEAIKASPAQVRLFDEASTLMVRLGSVPAPQITHHLVEVAEHVIDQRPEAALFATRDIVLTGGRLGGYQQEGPAVDAVVRIVERILAGHRGILRTPECLTALRELLDTFVDAGWPTAHRLAYGLEHIFR